MEVLAGYVSRELYEKALARIRELETMRLCLEYELKAKDKAFRSIYNTDEAQARAKEIGSYD